VSIEPPWIRHGLRDRLEERLVEDVRRRERHERADAVVLRTARGELERIQAAEGVAGHADPARVDRAGEEVARRRVPLEAACRA
jgi:hypothetical protein